MNQAAEIDVDAVLARVKLHVLQAAKASDVALAGVLNIPRATIASWRRRGSIPLEHIMNISRNYGLSIEWIIRGDGKKQLELAEMFGVPVELDILEIALHDAYITQKAMCEGYGQNMEENPASYAPLIFLLYTNLAASITDAYIALARDRDEIIKEMRLHRNLKAKADPRHFLRPPGGQ